MELDKVVDRSHADVPLSALLDAPVSVLHGVSEGDAEHLKAAFVECGDIVGALIGADSIPDDQKDCVQDAIDNEQAAEIIANQWTGADDSQEIADAKEQASACVTDDTDAATTTTKG